MGTKLCKDGFQTRKRELATTTAAPNTLLPNVLMRRKKTTTRGNKEGQHEHKNINKQMGETHIGQKWESTKESSDEDVKVAIMAIHKSSSTPRLFTNLSDDDDHHSPHIYLMAKGEKVKSKAKPSPPYSDISSSELSESSTDDDLSDNDEFVQITKNIDPKTKIFITKLLEDLESVPAELATRDDDLLEQEKMYIACKEALVLERSEVDSLNKALAEEQREHALTKKANIALNDKYFVLSEKHNKLEK